MSSLPKIQPNIPVLLKPEPLTPVSFAPFGTAVLSPLPQHLRKVPSILPEALYAPHQSNPQPANQNTALKTSPISPLENNYSSASNGLVSVFSCFPRQNTYLDSKTSKLRLRLEILERHPLTTQTFCPFNFSAPSSSPNLRSHDAQPRTYFLVIVAPTLLDSSAVPSNPPDLSRVKAFLAPVTADGAPGMAVTYAPGTWHAPMVVLGDRRVDFLVSQFANGVTNDDCQEVLVGDSDIGSAGNVVEIDLAGLGLGPGSEIETGLWKSKL